MSLRDIVKGVLTREGYRTATTATGDLAFEDDTLLGFVCETESVADLLATWESRQDEFCEGALST